MSVRPGYVKKNFLLLLSPGLPGLPGSVGGNYPLADAHAHEEQRLGWRARDPNGPHGPHGPHADLRGTSESLKASQVVISALSNV